MAAIILLWSGSFAFMALDARRYRWSQTPFWVQALEALCIFLLVYIGYLTFQENPYAAPVVKLQKDRGQKVITTGLYRYVRVRYRLIPLIW